jgi:RNA polymerase sigma factor (sigma-70 family)
MYEKARSQPKLSIPQSVKAIWCTDPSARPSDLQLIQKCLDGEQEAWYTLIDRYRNLIFSIPVKYGFSPEDSAEVFQEVCLTLLRELPRLREPSTLAAWLIKVTSHRCMHWRARQARHLSTGVEAIDSTIQEPPEDMLQEVERDQLLREAVPDLAERCQELIQMLFFTTPAVPYEEVARRLGVAKGSIGFLRKRCLARLRRILEEKGFSQV